MEASEAEEKTMSIAVSNVKKRVDRRKMDLKRRSLI